mmetsp:Transcript_20387/g.56505  ORF Transcript_20387/g.56505 Transcript_20387/m.56505 type:complete len:207 (+) Transcript_20387:1425-2045(+)
MPGKPQPAPSPLPLKDVLSCQTEMAHPHASAACAASLLPNESPPARPHWIPPPMNTAPPACAAAAELEVSSMFPGTVLPGLEECGAGACWKGSLWIALLPQPRCSDPSRATRYLQQGGCPGIQTTADSTPGQSAHGWFASGKRCGSDKGPMVFPCMAPATCGWMACGIAVLLKHPLMDSCAQNLCSNPEWCGGGVSAQQQQQSAAV